MNILQMRYFLALAQIGSLNATAEQLYLSPSALSKSISRLEADLGTRLFDRSGGGMQLTENGKIVRDSISEALYILDEMRSSIFANTSKEQRHLRIATTAYITGSDMVSSFTKAHPELFVSFKVVFVSGFEPGMLLNKYDILISPTNSVDERNLASIPLFKHTPLILVPEHHPLAAHTHISLAEIAAEPFIRSEPGMPWTRFVDQLFADQGLKLRPVMECIYDVRTKAVAAGQGLTIATETSVRLKPPPPGVVVRLLKDPCPQHNTCLFYHTQRQLNQATRRFIHFAREYYADSRKAEIT